MMAIIWFAAMQVDSLASAANAARHGTVDWSEKTFGSLGIRKTLSDQEKMISQ
jgi:hypothetical protein